MTEHPPSPVEVADFKFKLYARLKVFPDEYDFKVDRPLKLVASASKYGLIFVGIPNGFQCIRSTDIPPNEPQNMNHNVTSYQRRDFPLGFQPTHIDVNCENELFAVAILADGCAVLQVYIVQSVTSAQLRKVNEVRLSNTQGVSVSDLQWNPGVPNMIAVVMSDGSASVYEVKENSVSILSSIPQNAKASCLCWSPKGKQIVIGSKHGSLVQYKPELKAVKNCDPPKLGPSVVSVVSVHWLSNFQFIAVYKDATDSKAKSNVVIVNTPKNSPPKYVYYEDLFYESDTSRPEHYFIHQQLWHILVLCTTNSMETNVLSMNGDIWTQWFQEEGSRSELPLTKDHKDVHNVGIALDTSVVRPTPIGEKLEIGPMPFLLMFAHNGVLCFYQMINGFPQAPNVCQPPQPLPDSSGIHFFVKPVEGGSTILNIPAVPKEVKPPQTGEPEKTAIQPPSSQPINFAQVLSQFNMAQAPPTTNSFSQLFPLPAGNKLPFGQAGSLFQGGMSQPQQSQPQPSQPQQSQPQQSQAQPSQASTPLSTAKPPQLQTPFFQNTSFIQQFSQQQPAAKTEQPTAAPPAAQPASQAPSVPAQQQPQQQQKPVQTSRPGGNLINFGASLPQGNQIVSAKSDQSPSPAWAGINFQTQQQAPQLQKPPQPQPQPSGDANEATVPVSSGPAKTSQDTAQPPTTSAPTQAPSGGVPDQPDPPETPQADEVTEEVDLAKENELIIQHTKELIAELNSEMGNKQKLIKSSILQTEQNIKSNDLKDKLLTNLEDLKQFEGKLKESNIPDLATVNMLGNNLMELYGWYEKIRAKERMTKSSGYIELMESQDLDPITKHYLKNIDKLLYYLESQMKLAKAKLGSLWDNVESTMDIPAMEAIYQTIVAHHHILAANKLIIEKHELTLKIIHKRRFNRSSGKKVGDLELSTLADRLLKTKIQEDLLIDSSLKDVSNNYIVLANKTVLNEDKLSAIHDWYKTQNVIKTKVAKNTAIPANFYKDQTFNEMISPSKQSTPYIKRDIEKKTSIIPRKNILSSLEEDKSISDAKLLQENKLTSDSKSLQENLVSPNKDKDSNKIEGIDKETPRTISVDSSKNEGIPTPAFFKNIPKTPNKTMADGIPENGAQPSDATALASSVKPGPKTLLHRPYISNTTPNMTSTNPQTMITLSSRPKITESNTTPISMTQTTPNMSKDTQTKTTSQSIQISSPPNITTSNVLSISSKMPPSTISSTFSFSLNSSPWDSSNTSTSNLLPVTSTNTDNVTSSSNNASAPKSTVPNTTHSTSSQQLTMANTLFKTAGSNWGTGQQLMSNVSGFNFGGTSSVVSTTSAQGSTLTKPVFGKVTTVGGLGSVNIGNQSESVTIPQATGESTKSVTSSTLASTTLSSSTTSPTVIDSSSTLKSGTSLLRGSSPGVTAPSSLPAGTINQVKTTNTTSIFGNAGEVTTTNTSSIFGGLNSSSSTPLLFGNLSGATTTTSASSVGSMTPQVSEVSSKTPASAPLVFGGLNKPPTTSVFGGFGSVTTAGTVSNTTTTASIFGTSAGLFSSSTTATQSIFNPSPASTTASQSISTTSPASTTASQSIFSPSPASTTASQSIFGVSPASVTTSQSIFGGSPTSITASQPIFGSSINTTSTPSIFGGTGTQSSASPVFSFGNASTLSSMGLGSTTISFANLASATGSTTTSTTSTPVSSLTITPVPISSVASTITPSTSTTSTSAVATSSTPTSSASVSIFSGLGATTPTVSPAVPSTTTTSTPMFATGLGSFKVPATTTQSFFNNTPSFGATTTASIFGGSNQSVTTNFGTAASTFGAPSTTSFGTAATTASSFFGSASAFVTATTTPSFGSSDSGSIFGTANALSSASFFNTTTSNSSFGNQSAASIFGGASSFTTPTTTPSTFFGKTICSPTSTPNAFGATNVFGQASTTSASSIFGGENSFQQKPAFGQTVNLFGQTTSSGGNFGSSGGSLFGGAASFSSNTNQQGNIFQSGNSSPGLFSSGAAPGGPFSSPQAGQSFGAAPSFQSPARPFGATGNAPPVFGSTPAFGAAPAFGGSPTFSNSSPSKVFGAAEAAAPTFGSPGQQASSTFENLAQQDTVSFGNLAQQQTFQSPSFAGSSFSSWRS